MLFDGSGGERLTVCQCHSLSADVSEQGTGLRGEINKLLFSEGKKKEKNTSGKRTLRPTRGGVYILVTSRRNAEKQNVKSCYLGR